MSTFSWDNIVQGYQDRYDQAMGFVDNYGQTQRTELQRIWEDVLKKQEAQARGMGWGRSTVLPSLRMGVKKQQSDAMAKLNEELGKFRMQYATTLSGDKLSAEAAALTQEEAEALQREQMAQQKSLSESSLQLQRDIADKTASYQEKTLAQQLAMQEKQLASAATLQEKELANRLAVAKNSGGGWGGFGGGGGGGYGFQILPSPNVNQGSYFGFTNRAASRMAGSYGGYTGMGGWMS